jgi:hypothetical protein
MKCSNCGNVLVEGAKFCQFCGTPVKAKPAESRTEPAEGARTDIRLNVGHNEGQVVGQMNISGDQPVHIGGQQHYGDTIEGNKVDTAGGAYIESANTGGGDLVLGHKIEGDFVQGDKIQGDKITIGNVSHSPIAIGDGAQATVNQGVDAAMLAQLFQLVSQRIDQLPERAEIDKDELRDTAGRVEKEVAKGEEANPDRLKRWLDVLEKYAPDVVEIVVNALLNPGAGAASAVKAVLKQFVR